MFDTLVREDQGIWIRGSLDDYHNIGDAGSIPAGFAKILFNMDNGYVEIYDKYHHRARCSGIVYEHIIYL